MTDPNRVESILDTLDGLVMTTDVKAAEFGFSKADSMQAAQDLGDAKMMVRKALFQEYKDSIWRNFCIFGNRMFEECEFFNSNTFISDNWGIAVRKFDNWYYAVKIKNRDTMWGGILQTECPDDYPMHRMPADTICSKYPEIAMIKVVIHHMNVEGDA